MAAVMSLQLQMDQTCDEDDEERTGFEHNASPFCVSIHVLVENQSFLPVPPVWCGCGWVGSCPCYIPSTKNNYLLVSGDILASQMRPFKS